LSSGQTALRRTRRASPQLEQLSSALWQHESRALPLRISQPKLMFSQVPTMAASSHCEHPHRPLDPSLMQATTVAPSSVSHAEPSRMASQLAASKQFAS
jgi:hypothetical protein